MPPSRLRYVKVQVGPDGTEYHYFRHRGVYQRLPGSPGGADYMRRYAELLAILDVRPKRAAPGSVSEAVDGYRASTEFAALAPKTRRDYERMLDYLAPIGDEPLAGVKRHHVRLIWDHLKDRPRTARLFAQVASRLFTWGMDRGLLDVNPAAGIRRVGKPEPHRAWTDAEVAAFAASTPPEPYLTAFLLALHTGQRQGDILAMTRSRYDGATISVRQSKTGVALRIPVHSILKRHLDGLPARSMMLVAGDGGAPIPIDTFRHVFRNLIRAAGLHGITFHGLRATAATRLAEAGCSPHQIAAITGHKSLSMVEKYTNSARQELLGAQAIERLEDHRKKD